MDCSPPGSSVHGISQAKILGWVTISFCRGSSWPRNQTHISYVSCIGRQVLYHWVTWAAQTDPCLLQIPIMLSTSQNKSVYTMILGVCNRFVTRNGTETVQMKNTLNKSFVSVLPCSKNISRSQFLVPNSHHYTEGTERLWLPLSLRMWCRPAVLPRLTSTNSRTWQKPHKKMWRVPVQPSVHQTMNQGLPT